MKFEFPVCEFSSAPLCTEHAQYSESNARFVGHPTRMYTRYSSERARAVIPRRARYSAQRSRDREFEYPKSARDACRLHVLFVNDATYTAFLWRELSAQG